MSRRHRPPTTKQLLRALDRCTLVMQERVKVDGRYYYAVCEKVLGDPDDRGVIRLSRRKHRGEKTEGLIRTAIHELIHLVDGHNGDHRNNHRKIRRWELTLYRSPALREAIAIRIGNAYMYGEEDA